MVKKDEPQTRPAIELEAPEKSRLPDEEMLPGDGDEKHARPKAEHVKKAKNRLLSLLDVWPTATPEEQATELGLSVKQVGRYRKELKDGGFLKDGLIPTRKLDRVYQQFWIFIETTCDQNAKDPKNKEDYQKWVAEQILRRLREKGDYAETLISRGIQILLGAEWDMMLCIYGRDFTHVQQFVVEQVRSCPHVLRTSTAWAMKTATWPEE